VAELERGGSDLVVGSRFLEPNPKYHQTPLRLTGAWFLRALIRTLTGLKITDCTSGFRAANRRVIRAFAHWYPEDYPEPEVILLLHRTGYRISELAVRMRQRHGGRSSINVLEGIFYVLKVTVCLLLDLVREPWPRGRVIEDSDGCVDELSGESDERGDRHAAGRERERERERERGAAGEGVAAGQGAVEPGPQPVPGGLRWDAPAAGRPTAPRL
jgi:hypothetical protein